MAATMTVNAFSQEMSNGIADKLAHIVLYTGRIRNCATDI
jgi:hypothetical protein